MIDQPAAAGNVNFHKTQGMRGGTVDLPVRPRPQTGKIQTTGNKVKGNDSQTTVFFPDRHTAGIGIRVNDAGAVPEIVTAAVWAE